MADIGETAATVQTLFDQQQHNSLAPLVAAALRRAEEMQGVLAAELDGSTSDHSETVRAHMAAVVTSLGEAATHLAGASEASEALITSWRVSAEPSEPIPTLTTVTPADRAPAVREHDPYPPEPFNPEIDMTDRRIQNRLNRPVEQVFDQDRIGFTSSRRILGHLNTYGIHTVRDLFLVGKRAAFSSLGKAHCDIIERELAELCPGLPFNNYLSPQSAAFITDTLDDIPVQALFPNHRHHAQRRVTIGETLFDDGTYNNQGPLRVRSGGSWSRDLERFAAEFTTERRRLDRNAYARQRRAERRDNAENE